MSQFEEIISKKYFAGIHFTDERERQVFLSYVRGFAVLLLDPAVKNLVEIGGGQSTTLLASLGERVGWKIVTIDMNPEAIALKIRNQGVSDATLRKVQFQKGVSLTAGEIRAFYDRPLVTVGGVPLEQALKAARDFIDVSLDGRKAPKVARALDAAEFSADGVIAAVLKSDRLPPQLIEVFRTPRDEFAFHGDGAGPQEGCLRQIMDSDQIDAVFLDSGEFSSLPEWEVVEKRLPLGGYVVLHDIFFPKSFKNWLVCGAIQANPAFEVLYVDRSTPQGLMVAQKRR